MSEQDKPFVVNDRRKFRADGELREPTAEGAGEAASDPGHKVLQFSEAREHAAAPTDSEAHPERRNSPPIPINSAHTVTPAPQPDENAPRAAAADDTLPPPPTAEEIAQVDAAYTATADRLDTVMRAANPGAEHLPPMNFTRLVQSVYMTAMMQLGAGTPQGEQARVDLLGARQSIDMLAVIAEKSGSNLENGEKQLIDSALFELRMGFLEMTQLLARQAANRPGAPGSSPLGGGVPAGPGGKGPRIVV